MNEQEIKDDAAHLLKVLKQEVEKLKKMQLIEIPDAIVDASSVTSEVIDEVIPPLPTDALALWRKRAAKIENVNKVLSQFETDVVVGMTLGTGAIFAREIYRQIRVYEWLIGHVGIITIVITAAVKTVWEKYSGKLRWNFIQLMFAIVNLDAAKIKDIARATWEDMKEVIEVIVSVVMAGMIVAAIESGLAAMTGSKFLQSLGAINNAKVLAEDKMRLQAFPQGKGRVRRRKVHRLRKAKR